MLAQHAHGGEILYKIVPSSQDEQQNLLGKEYSMYPMEDRIILNISTFYFYKFF